MKKPLINLRNVRTDEQRAVMERIALGGICPFCRENFEKYHPHEIIRETSYWFATKVAYPYEGTGVHLLLVSKEHLEDPSFLEPEAQSDFFRVVGWLTKEFKILGGSVLMRFGDFRFNGSSVAHLHAHVIVGEADEVSGEPLRVKVGFKNKNAP